MDEAVAHRDPLREDGDAVAPARDLEALEDDVAARHEDGVRQEGGIALEHRPPDAGDDPDRLVARARDPDGERRRAEVVDAPVQQQRVARLERVDRGLQVVRRRDHELRRPDRATRQRERGEDEGERSGASAHGDLPRRHILHATTTHGN